MNKPSPTVSHVVTSDGQRIALDHYRGGHRSVVVIVHGFFNSKNAVLMQALAGELLPKWDVIVMDLRGHGHSTGLFTWTALEDRDVIAVLEYARTRYPKTGVVGFSLGAAISLIVASRTDLIDSLVSVSAPTKFSKIEFHFWRLDPENDILYNLKEGRIGKGVRPGPFWLKKEGPIAVVDKITNPVLFLHGTGDWLVRSWHSQRLYETARCPKKLVLVDNGPHAEYLVRKNREETVNGIKGWLSDTLA